MNQPLKLTTLILCGYAGLSSLNAATISWGGAFGSSHYAADGSSLETGTGPTDVTFELGIFVEADGTAFSPTTANASDWQARWVPVTRNDGLDGPDTTTPGSSDFFPDTGFFGDNAEIGSLPEATDNSSLTSGRQVYIWGFDDQSFTEGQANPPEWLLFTGADGGTTPSSTNWLVPEADGSTQGDPPLIWEVTNANTAVFGRIPNSVGGGSFDPVPVPFGPDDTQFAVVPEPSSTLMGLIFGGSLLLRRKRSSNEA